MTMTSLGEVLSVVAEVYDVYEEALKGPSRMDMFVEARHAFCYMGAQLGFTQDDIAAEIGRERSNISSSVMSFKARVECDPRAKDRYVKLKTSIRRGE